MLPSVFCSGCCQLSRAVRAVSDGRGVLATVAPLMEDGEGGAELVEPDAGAADEDDVDVEEVEVALVGGAATVVGALDVLVAGADEVLADVLLPPRVPLNVWLVGGLAEVLAEVLVPSSAAGVLVPVPAAVAAVAVLAAA